MGARLAMRAFVRASLTAALLWAGAAGAASYYSCASGDWSDSATWRRGGSCPCSSNTPSPPDSNDNVFVCSGTTVTLDRDEQLRQIEIDGTLQTDNGSRTLTLSSTSPLFTLNSGGAFIPGNSTVVMDRSGNTAATAGTATQITFFNLSLTPAISGNRSYTFGSAAITINGNFLIDVPSTGGNRTLTVEQNSAFTIAGTTTIQALASGNEDVTYDTNGNAFASGRLEIGSVGTSSNVITFNAGSSTITLNGAAGPLLALGATANKTFNAGTSNVIMASPNSVQLTSGTFTGASAFNQLTVSMPGKSGFLGGAIAVNGLNVSAGTLADAGYSISGSGSGNLQVASGAALTLGSTGTATAFPTSFASTTLTGSTVTYGAGVSQTVATAPAYHNLVFSGTGSKTTAAGTLSIAGDWTVDSASNLAANATTVRMSGAGKQISGTTAPAVPTLNVTGSCTNNVAGTLSVTGALGGSGTLTQGANRTLALGGSAAIATLDANSNDNTVIYNGAAAQTMKAAAYRNLTLNNSGGASLSGATTVNGTLEFTSGNVTTGAHTLSIGSAGTVSGAGPSQHVVGNVARTYASAGAFTYPLGDGTNYTPVKVEFATLPTPGALTVATPGAPASDHPNTTGETSGIDPARSVNRYWTLKDSALAGTCTVTFDYLGGTPVDLDSGATPADFVIARGSSCSGSGAGRACIGGWSLAALAGTPTAIRAGASGIALTSGAPEADFAIGEHHAVSFQREKEFIYSRELY